MTHSNAQTTIQDLTPLGVQRWTIDTSKLLRKQHIREYITPNAYDMEESKANWHIYGGQSY